MSRTLSVYDIAALAHREMTRVSPEAALAEIDAEEELERLTDQPREICAYETLGARLDVIEARQKTQEGYLKAILAKLDGIGS